MLASQLVMLACSQIAVNAASDDGALRMKRRGCRGSRDQHAAAVTAISPFPHFLPFLSLDPVPSNCYRSAPDCVFLATAQFTVHGSMKRRPFLLLCATSLLAGCSSWSLFSPGKSKAPGDTPDDQPHTVGDLAVPFGMFPVKIEAVGLVSGLHGTGSDPEPSPQRAMLMAEMQRRGVENPNQLLATPQLFARDRPRLSCGRAFKRTTISTWNCGSRTAARPPACAAVTCWKPACRTWR